MSSIAETDLRVFLSPDSDLPPDVIFLVQGEDEEGGGERIRAHKQFLAAVSPVFRRMLFGPLNEKGEVVVKETTPEAFNTMIKYLYHPQGGDAFNLDHISCAQELFELLNLATKYEIISLASMTAHALRNLGITRDNMVFIVNVAMAKNYRTAFEDVSTTVLERCLEFFYETTSGAGDVFALLEETRDNFPGGNLEQALRDLMDVKASLQPPGQLELRSCGGAGESQGSLLGLFQLLPDGGEGGTQGPVYRQLHDGDNQQVYLYRAGDFWYVNYEVGKEAGGLRAKVMTELDELRPPLNGWENKGGGKWESDPTMECSREVSPPCTEIIVELDGPAKEKYPQMAGSYFPVEGKINLGRWVLQQSTGSKRYLTVLTGTTSWAIGPTISGLRGWIGSASAGGPCPAQASNAVNKDPRYNLTSWGYVDDGWKNGQIRLVCKKHK